MDFDEMAQVLRDEINSNCYIIGRHGKIMAAPIEGFACGIMDDIIYRLKRFPEE